MAQILKIDRVSLAGRDGKVLSEIDLELQAGEAVALMGPSGSGKTALLNALAGLEKPDSGNIYVFGYSVADDLTRAASKTGTNFHWRHGLSPTHGVLDTLMREASCYKGIDKGYVLEIATALGLRECEQQRVSELLPGQRKLLSLAGAFCGNPRMLLLDEPFACLSPLDRRRAVDLINSFTVRKGAAALIATGECAAVSETCARAAVLLSGRLMGVLDLRARADEDELLRFRFYCDKPHTASTVLGELGCSASEEDDCASAPLHRRQISHIILELLKAHVQIYEIRAERATLAQRYEETLSFMGGFSSQ